MFTVTFIILIVIMIMLIATIILLIVSMIILIVTMTMFIKTMKILIVTMIKLIVTMIVFLSLSPVGLGAPLMWHANDFGFYLAAMHFPDFIHKSDNANAYIWSSVAI